MIHRSTVVSLGIALLAASAACAQNDRDTKVRADRSQFEAVDNWVYNDLDRGLALAREEDKPLLIVLRCIP